MEKYYCNIDWLCKHCKISRNDIPAFKPYWYCKKYGGKLEMEKEKIVARYSFCKEAETR